MLMRGASICSFLLLCLVPLMAQEARERSPGLETTYDLVTTPAGYQVRVVHTKPVGVPGRLPAVFFVGWLSCDSIIYPAGKESDGFSKLILRLVRGSGIASYRMDKPGVGESGGPKCEELDLEEELRAYQAAFKHFLTLPFVDPSRIVVVGLSNGGGIAPLVGGDTAVAGYVSVGGWGRTWLEHMLEHERVRMQLTGKSPQQISTAMRLFPTFYTRYLIGKEKPGAIVASDARLKAIWYGNADGQYGRPAAFFQQLQALDLGAAWARVRVPVLVVRGGYDWIMTQNDADAIVHAVNSTSPAKAKLLVRPGMDHFLIVHRSFSRVMDDHSQQFDDGLVPCLSAWLKDVGEGRAAPRVCASK